MNYKKLAPRIVATLALGLMCTAVLPNIAGIARESAEISKIQYRPGSSLDAEYAYRAFGPEGACGLACDSPVHAVFER